MVQSFLTAIFNQRGIQILQWISEARDAPNIEWGAFLRGFIVPKFIDLPREGAVIGFTLDFVKEFVKTLRIEELL